MGLGTIWPSGILKPLYGTLIVLYHIEILQMLLGLSQARGFQPVPRLNIKTVFPRYGDSHLKKRRSRDRLIFNMGILILIRWHFYIETAPWWCETLPSTKRLFVDEKFLAPRNHFSSFCACLSPQMTKIDPTLVFETLDKSVLPCIELKSGNRHVRADTKIDVKGALETSIQGLSEILQRIEGIQRLFGWVDSIHPSYVT